jgi:glycopeptide antibiotics resistance protein
MPLDRRPRVGAIAALAGYSVFVAVIGLWPSPVDRPLDPALYRVLVALKGIGIRPADAYNAIEFTANVAFFVLPAMLVVFIVGRRRWWIAPVVGLLCSVAIELAQFFLLPSRFATISDVIANTLGSLIGCGIGVLVLSRRRAPRGRTRRSARGRHRAVARDPRSS